MLDQRTLHGVYFALAAYGFWGVAPIYFKLLDQVSVFEILSHRVIWSLVLLFGILVYTRQLSTLRIDLHKVGLCLITAILLSLNWLIFIYAVIDDNIVEASLGYFINPLVSVFLGMIFLRESLRPLQWIAIGMAIFGIVFQLVAYGSLPWISVALAFSFGFYGLIRKSMQLPAIAGLTIETLWMLPVALTYLAWIYSNGNYSFGQVGYNIDLLLIMGGVVTSFPMLCFAAAVGRLSLTSVGMIQYLAPSLSLLIAVLLYGEPFGYERQVTFACIWAALLMFSGETLYHHRRINRRLTVETL